MTYYNSYHAAAEFLKQGRGKLLVDERRWEKALKASSQGKKSRLFSLVQLAKEHSVPVTWTSSNELEGVLESSHYRGFLLKITDQIKIETGQDFDSILRLKPSLIVLLDGILDIGNIGALLRSCDLFGVGAVLTSFRSKKGGGDRMEKDNQLGRSSAGANAWVPLLEINLHRAVKELREAGYWIYAADLTGKSLFEIEVREPVALILGAEEKGISHQVRMLADFSCFIPTKGHMDSLNVAVAGGIFLYEMRRQLGFESTR